MGDRSKYPFENYNQDSNGVVDPMNIMLPGYEESLNLGPIPRGWVDAPSTVPSGSVVSHETSDRLEPPYAATSATSFSEPRSPRQGPQKPPEPSSQVDFSFLGNAAGFHPEPPIWGQLPDLEEISSRSPVERDIEFDENTPPESGSSLNDETQAESSRQQSVIVMHCTKDTTPVILVHGDQSPDISQRPYESVVTTLNRFYTPTHTLSPPGDKQPKHGPAGRKEKRYLCLFCTRENKEALRYDIRSFRRHVSEQHHPSRQFRCPFPECTQLKYRRHKLKQHFRDTHGRQPEKAEIDGHTDPLPYPPQCSLCTQMVHSWDEFHDCVKKHCFRTSENNTTPKLPFQPGGGRIGKVRVTSSRVLQRSPVHSARGGSSLRQSAGRTEAAPLADSMPNPSLSSLSQAHQMDGSNSAQEGPVVPEHESRQPPQSNGPGFPPTLPTQEPGDSSTELNSRRCCVCRRLLTSSEAFSRGMENRVWCQFCLISHLSNATAPRYDGINHSQIQDNLPSTFNASFFYPDPNPNPQAEQGPETQYQSPWADRENPPPYFGHGGGYQVGVMLDAVVPAHGEIDVRRISTVKSEMTKFDNPCLTLPLKRRSTAGALNSLLRELSKLTLSDKITAFPRDISLTTVSHPPAPGGQNTCRTLTRLPEHYSGRAIAPLAPGKKLEMDLRILPPVGRAPGHHLRTRVRVFARFLKPRPSVVKSSQDDKKRKVCNPAFEQALESALERLSDEQLGSDTDDSEYSDSASVFDEDMASMFSSFSDISVETPIQPCYSTDLDSASESDGYFASPSPSSDLSAAPTIRPSSPVNLDAEAMPDAGVDSVQFPCTDSSMLFPTQSSLPPCADPNGSDAMFEATKVSFELDLDSSLCKMSQLPDGLAHGVYSDPTSMNPAQLLEYILKDLLYSMTVMSRSTDDDDDDAPPSDQ